MTQAPQFNFDEWLSQGKPATSQATVSTNNGFDLDTWIANSKKDVTGFGEKQAVDFNQQLATRNLIPVENYKEFENYGKKLVNYYQQEGYSPEQIAKIQNDFTQNADPRNKTGVWEYYLGDRVNDLMTGTGNLATDVLAAVPENTPVVGKLADDAEKYTREVTKDWQNDLSDKNKINTYLGDRAEQEALANGANEASALLANVKENPMQIASLFTQQSPQLLLSGLGKVAPAITYAMGGAGRMRNDIETAYDETFKNNPNQLLALPEIQQRLKQGMTFEEAVNDAKTDITDNWKSILAGAAISATESFTPFGKLGQGLNRGVLGTLGKEISQEAFQEGAEQLNSNLAVGEIDGKTQALDNVVRNATLGGIAGFSTGIPSAIDAHFNRNKPNVEQQSDNVIDGISPQTEPTATTSSPPKADEQAVENIVSHIADETERNELAEELRNDIEDGLIAERAKENTSYGKLAQAYLQVVSPEQDFANNVEATNASDLESTDEQVGSSNPILHQPQEVETTELDTAQQDQSQGNNVELDEAVYSRSPIKSVEANIKRGRERMTQAILNKADVKRGMYNQEFGWIDFVWGDDGTTKKRNRFGEPNGRGIAHIFEARGRKDKLGYEETAQMLVNNLVETIAKGEVVTRAPRRLVLDYKSPNEANGHRVILTKPDESNAWLLSGYEKFPVGGNSKLHDKTIPMHDLPTRSRQEVGATGKTNLHQSQPQSNNPDFEIEQAREVLRKALGEYADRVEIVRTADLDPNDRHYKNKATSEGWFSNGRLQINLDNITASSILNKDERLAWVAWHELAHNGIAVRFHNVLQNVLTKAKENPVVSMIARRIQKERENDGVPISENIAIEEAVVEIFAAQETGNWAELENRYNLKIHRDWKDGTMGLDKDLSLIARIFKGLISAITGRDVHNSSDKDIFDILAGIKQGIAKNTENQTAYNDEIRYSLNESSDSEFAQAVDAVANGEWVEQQIINVGTTPNVLKMLGLPDVNVVIHAKTLSKVMRDKHSVEAAVLKAIPAQINNPVAVMKSSTQSNGYVVLTELVEQENGKDKPIIAALHLKQDKNGLELINIASVYGRSDEQILRGLENDLLYWNKEKGAKFLDNFTFQLRSSLSENSSEKGSTFLNTFGLQLPAYVSNESNLSEANIKTESDLSQYQTENSDDDIRYSRSQSKLERLEKLRNAKTITISGNEIEPSDDIRQYRRNAFEFGKTLRGNYVNKDTGRNISLARTGITEVLHHDVSNPEHLQSIAAIPQIIENAIYIDTVVNEEKGKNPDIQEYEYYLAGLNIGGTDYTVKAVVGISTTGDKYYDHKLTRIEKGDLLEMTSRLSSAEISNLSPEIDDKRLLHILQVEDNEPRYSRRQSILDTIKSGKVEHEPENFIGKIKAKGFASWWANVQKNFDFALTDETRPVSDWVNSLDISRAEQVDLISELDRAEGIRHSLNSEITQNYLRPLMQNISKLAKKHGKDVEWTKVVVEHWYSARYSIMKNEQILERERLAMEDAKTALDEARQYALLANEDGNEVYDKAEAVYRKAERQYRYRKHDVELNSWEKDEDGNFKVPRKVGVAGWTIPHAKAIIAGAEQHFSVSEMETVMKPLKQAVIWNIYKNFEANRITETERDEYLKQPNYVPLTGDPDRKEESDFIGGASQRGVNTSKDKQLKGRTNSEADGAIDAIYRMLDKTNANYAWQGFKNKINTVYEDALNEAKQSGQSEQEAKAEVEKRTGISRTLLKGMTRTNDNVLIRKAGKVYYEYSLPGDVIKALKGSQKNDTDYVFGRLLEITGIKTLTGAFARGVTQFKPAFAPTNMVRDVWEKSGLITTREILGADGKDLSQKAKNRVGNKLFSALINPFETKRLMKATGRLAKGDTENLDLNDEYQRDLKELIQLGGVSNYSTYLARTEKDLVSEIKKLHNPNKRIVEAASKLVAMWNGSFDYVSSLAAYRALKAEGVPAERAAVITLNLSNFRKQGWIAKHFKPLYMFLNPALQGGKNLVQLLKTKRGRVYIAGRTVFSLALWSVLLALDDDDEETGKRMFSNGDLSREILIPTGVKDKYIRIPVGYGAPQVVNNLSTNILKLFHNQITVSEAVGNIIAHNAKSIMPVSPSEISATNYPLEKIIDTLTPTLFKGVTEWVMDRNAFGNTIKPSFVQSDKLLSQQSKSTTAPFWEDTAEYMQEHLGFDAHPEMYKHIFDSYRGILGVFGDFLSASIENKNREMHGRSAFIPVVNNFFGIKGERRISSEYFEYESKAKEVLKEYNYHKEKGTLRDWATPEKVKIVKWYQTTESEINKLRKIKQNLNKREGKISDENFARYLQNYNLAVENAQRRAVYEWRKREGLNTIRTK